MTDHLTEQQILALASPQQERDPNWLQHVADCAACRDKLAACRATWQLLGHWQLPAELERPDASWRATLSRRISQRQQWTLFWRPTLQRAAAVILIAAGVGIGAAWYSAPAVAADPTQLAAGSLELDALSANRSTDLEVSLGLPVPAGVQP